MLTRRYRRSDLGAVLELFHDTVHTICARDYDPHQLEAWAPPVADKVVWNERLSGATSYVAEEYRMIIGFGSLTVDGWIDTIYTHRAFQGRGVATMLLSKLNEEAIRLDIPMLRVFTSITARPFFAARGFEEDWEQEKAHNGSVFTGYVMSRRLGEPTQHRS